ncbi:16379_t:CDS:1, partial [Racocetra persica]
HIMRDCQDRDKESNQTDMNMKFKNIDIWIVEFIKINPELANKYLKVELLNTDEQYNMRPIGKGKEATK